MKEKKLLRKLGEETLYSAKGHFKSADFRRIQTKWTIISCMVLNLVGVIGILLVPLTFLGSQWHEAIKVNGMVLNKSNGFIRLAIE